jgi:hypothetical protein
MISKTILLAALAALPLAAGVAHASSPLLKLNEDGSTAIFFVADASTAYNDNLFYQPNKTDDVIFTVAPGFELVAGGRQLEIRRGVQRIPVGLPRPQQP